MWEWRRNTQITLFQHIREKTLPADPRLRPKLFPSSSRLSPAAPLSFKVLPNEALDHQVSTLFGTSCTTWAYHLARLVPASNFQLKTTLQTGKTIQICIFRQRKCNQCVQITNKMYRLLLTFSIDLGSAAACSGPLHLIHLGMDTFISSDPLYYMMIRRRGNKSIYIYIYIYIDLYIEDLIICLVA